MLIFFHCLQVFAAPISHRQALEASKSVALRSIPTAPAFDSFASLTAEEDSASSPDGPDNSSSEENAEKDASSDTTDDSQADPDEESAANRTSVTSASSSSTKASASASGKASGTSSAPISAFSLPGTVVKSGIAPVVLAALESLGLSDKAISKIVQLKTTDFEDLSDVDQSEVNRVLKKLGLSPKQIKKAGPFILRLATNADDNPDSTAEASDSASPSTKASASASSKAASRTLSSVITRSTGTVSSTITAAPSASSSTVTVPGKATQTAGVDLPALRKVLASLGRKDA
jgi:hypothetical protein